MVEKKLKLGMKFLENESLEHLRKQKLQGHVIQSRAQWVQKGENISVIQNQELLLNKTIKKVELNNEQLFIINQKYLIILWLCNEKLYSENEDQITLRALEDLLDKSHVSKLQLETSKTLDENISEKRSF